MRFFKTLWTTDEYRAVEGQAPYEIPLGTCPVCQNFRGMPGIAYPWIDAKRIVDKEIEKRLRWGRTRKRGDPYTSNWEEIDAIRSRFRKVLDPMFPLPPCAEFGTFCGKIFAKPAVTDSVMPDSCTFLARREVVERLIQLGNSLQVFEIALKQQQGKYEDLIQVWAPPTGVSAASAAINWCQHCDRGSVGRTDVVDQSTVPSNSDLFILKDNPHFLILSEKLILDIEAYKFSGLRYEPILCE